MNEQISRKEIKGTFQLDLMESLGDAFKENDEIKQPIHHPAKADEALHSLHHKLPESLSEAADNNHESPIRGDFNRLAVCRNSRVGNETLSIQEFKENLGSFEEKFEDVLGNFLLNSQSSSGTLTL